MAKKKSAAGPAAYDESKIQTLSALEHIRLRPGMYIGRLGDGSHFEDGIYVLLKEVIDNSVDEFIMDYGARIVIKVDADKVSVRDFGRGIPLGKVIDCVSIINTGGKFNNEVFQFSVGLNGVGTKAVNALSSSFRVVSYREGRFFEARFAKGELIGEQEGKSAEPNGTLIEFIPDHDPVIFGEYEFREEFIEERLWNYAYLNTGLSIDYNRKIFTSKHGLLDLLDKQVGTEGLYVTIHHKSERLEFAFTHTQNYGENYFSYVNGQHTSDGGTHLWAFKEGILKGINEFYKKSYTAPDVRDGLTGAISIKLQDPVFESQTKNKLGNTEVRAWITQEVKEAIIDFLMKNSEAANKLSEKIASNEKLRKELAAVKGAAREAAKKVSLNIPKLKDCKYHLNQSGEKGERSMIFLTEGDSASGSMVGVRDVYTQAIFSLRGKVLNVFDKKRTDIYKNEELYNLMIALGLENGIDGLRYGKVIIATDADTDGFHIRNLLMTYFLTYFEDLVLAGRLFILETPLFRVRNKQETTYCYNESQRDEAVSRIRGAEITRFKGLGEINPSEFRQFIGEEMRLIPVSIASSREMHLTMKFYMGDNTPERREFIMENLI
ncbi:MAG: DNA topoisomerase IV subunit B [Sphaerochaetaceae bacterium]|jgi:topoisomerase-4 subunit B|nr:DNA topoisomerase IV subunit B [Sphaerochaetaceae bacterium]MDX9938816.1 DNA topoisomerase IV subunit B [Sphaerochaetaceae bacterium]